MIYENGVLKRILIDGGYIEGGAYYFYLTDHLGNNRVVADASGNIKQTNHYYPFGMSFAEGTVTSSQPYKYNGKELDTDRGLNLYDYSARYMDPVLGRFNTVDPMAEKYYSISPYVYVGNNPNNRIDPNGMDDYSVNLKGKIELVKRTGDEMDRLIAFGKNNKIEYDNDGNMANSSFTVNKGILNDQKKSDQTTYMSVKGNEQAKGMFEFLSKNTDVEWGRVSYGKSSNYISTNNSSRDNGIETITYGKLFKTGNSHLINSIDHSHPNLDYINPLPSGFSETPMIKGETGDKGFAE